MKKRIHNATLRRGFNRWSATYRAEIVSRVQRRGYGYTELANLVTQELQEGSILEVGTGPGNLGVEVARFLPGHKLVGVDIAPDMLRQAQLTGAYTDLIEADATNLPFDDGEFENIFSSFMLHSASAVQQAVNELHRVCRPGGRVVIIDLVRSRRRVALASALADKLHSLRREHYSLSNYFSVGELSDWMHQSGFGRISSRPLGPNERYRHAVIIAQKSP